MAAVTDSKTYDGTTTSAATPIITAGNLVGTDTANFTQSFATRNAGTGLTLNASGTVSDGNGGANFAVTFAPNATGVINQRVVTISGVRSADGTANAPASALTITNNVDGANLTIWERGRWTARLSGRISSFRPDR